LAGLFFPCSSREPPGNVKKRRERVEQRDDPLLSDHRGRLFELPPMNDSRIETVFRRPRSVGTVRARPTTGTHETPPKSPFGTGPIGQDILGLG
jgi:hypothetical protein